MFYNISKLLLSYFDTINKKKVCTFLKDNKIQKMSTFLDVGSHHGETIKTFKKNFIIENILAFEPSKINFKILEKNYRDEHSVKLFNIAIGEKRGKINLQQHYDSESSTIVQIDQNTNYYKKKNFYLNFLNIKKNKLDLQQVEIDRLDNILKNEKIKLVDILKIDTEGYDFHVIKSMGDLLKNVKFIYFEHHFHKMLKKGYNFKDVNSFLKSKNFRKVFKTKMFFRKTFEYIYKNVSMNI